MQFRPVPERSRPEPSPVPLTLSLLDAIHYRERFMGMGSYGSVMLQTKSMKSVRFRTHESVWESLRCTPRLRRRTGETRFHQRSSCHGVGEYHAVVSCCRISKIVTSLVSIAEGGGLEIYIFLIF